MVLFKKKPGWKLSIAQLDKMVECVEKEGVNSDSAATIARLLQWCGKLKSVNQGQRLHAHMNKTPQLSNVVLQNHLINMYGKCGRLEDAREVFGLIRHELNLVSWNSMISAYAREGDSRSAVLLFQQMHLEGMAADKVTYTTVLSACSSPASFTQASVIHGSITSRGLQRDVILCTALVTAYCRCGSLRDARQTFDGMKQRNVVTWTALISGYAHHGQMQQALDLFHAMDVAPNAVTFLTLINLCADFVSLAEGRRIHARFVAADFCDGEEGREEVLAAVMIMYGRCGSVEDALIVFRAISHPNICSWNAIISACARNGRGEEALRLFHDMPQQPDVVTLCAALAACAAGEWEEEGRRVHERIRELGVEENVQIGTSLMSMYGKCGRVAEAREIFDCLEDKNVVSWNAMLSAYLQNGQVDQVLELYSRMLQQGVPPNGVTLVSVVNACCSLRQLTTIDAECCCGDDIDPQVSNALVFMYGRLGSVDDAWKMFHRCRFANAVTWNGLLTAYARSNEIGDAARGFQLLRRMHAEGVTPDRVTFITLCGMLITHLQQQQQDDHQTSTGMADELLVQIVGCGYEWDPVIGTGMIALLGKSGRVEDACDVFEVITNIRSDIVPWNAMITAYLDTGQWRQALRLLRLMQLRGIKPDVTCLVCMLGCVNVGRILCGAVEDWLLGEEVGGNVSVRNALINMFAKCGRLGSAASVFRASEQRDVISWNVMIAAAVQAGKGDEALVLFRQMQLHGWRPDKVTYVNLLNACDGSAMLRVGRSIHERIAEQGLLLSYKNNSMGGVIQLATALSNMYSKCGSMADAAAVFRGMQQRNVVSWNGMIGAYAQTGHARLALSVFCCMQLEGVRGDGVTWINVLDACAVASSVQVGRRVHTWIQESGHASAAVRNALVNMHAKCGNVEEARRVFEGMKHDEMTCVTWSAMVAAYAQAGRVDEAFRLFHVMQREGQRPNHITFISLLAACSHAGMVERGCLCYVAMVLDHGLPPGQEHYGCMIDLLGRAGWMEAAEEMTSKTTMNLNKEDASEYAEEDVKAWMTLLAACTHVGDLKHGSNAADKVLAMDPSHAAAYIAISNAHAASNSSSPRSS